MDDKLLNKFNGVENFHWWWEGRREILKHLLLLQKNPKKILDVGCGTGETLNFLSRLLPETQPYGVDSSSLSVRLSKLNSLAKVYIANATNLPFKNESFDVVLLLDVVEHIASDKKALYEAKRVLRDGGKIIVTCPATPFIWSIHDSLQNHKRRYTKKVILNLAKRVDLKINFVGYFNFFLFIPIAVIRLASRIPSFRWLANYDNSINFEIAKNYYLNSIFKTIFLNDVRLMFTFKYPFGVSILAVFEK